MEKGVITKAVFSLEESLESLKSLSSLESLGNGRIPLFFHTPEAPAILFLRSVLNFKSDLISHFPASAKIGSDLKKMDLKNKIAGA